MTLLGLVGDEDTLECGVSRRLQWLQRGVSWCSL